MDYRFQLYATHYYSSIVQAFSASFLAAVTIYSGLRHWGFIRCKELKPYSRDIRKLLPNDFNAWRLSPDETMIWEVLNLYFKDGVLNSGTMQEWARYGQNPKNTLSRVALDMQHVIVALKES
ncbi:hypothetical protein AMATHDRAFT_3981 [Amanita thiersii Skay4041]|uniref:Uncharacterized protein n=1 Tax=Amanita thiersii Skay4041 TaxID=703135 RepID=A0A2A9NM69_9AGAR|nr:hypothetical protein AMATHDRAFT_3981 [Amanita thiersii Skay4041]